MHDGKKCLNQCLKFSFVSLFPKNNSSSYLIYKLSLIIVYIKDPETMRDNK